MLMNELKSILQGENPPRCPACNVRIGGIRIHTDMRPAKTGLMVCARCGHIYNFNHRDGKATNLKPKQKGERMRNHAYAAEIRASQDRAVKRLIG